MLQLLTWPVMQYLHLFGPIVLDMFVWLIKKTLHSQSMLSSDNPEQYNWVVREEVQNILLFFFFLIFNRVKVQLSYISLVKCMSNYLVLSLCFDKMILEKLIHRFLMQWKYLYVGFCSTYFQTFWCLYSLSLKLVSWMYNTLADMLTSEKHYFLYSHRINKCILLPVQSVNESNATLGTDQSGFYFFFFFFFLEGWKQWTVINTTTTATT